MHMSGPRIVVGAVGIGSGYASAVPAATFVPTGRHIDGRDECWSRVQAWAQLEDRAAIASHSLSEALTAALAGARLCGEDQLTCYRGVLFCEPFVPTASDMGPPPPGSIGTGRYNYDDQVVLYLSRSRDGVSREMRESRETAWIQSYTLDLKHLRIADFRPPVDTLLNHIFWWTEMVSADHGGQFVFSQFVAGRVANFFDGMLVPGVRGDESIRYDNVVVFRPQHHWQNWLTEGSDPQRLSQ